MKYQTALTRNITNLLGADLRSAAALCTFTMSRLRKPWGAKLEMFVFLSGSVKVHKCFSKNIHVLTFFFSLKQNKMWESFFTIYFLRGGKKTKHYFNIINIFTGKKNPVFFSRENFFLFFFFCIVFRKTQILFLSLWASVVYRTGSNRRNKRGIEHQRK